MPSVHEILSKMEGDKVEYRRMTYENTSYFIPYQTIYVNGTEVAGLRTMDDRKELLEKQFKKYKCKKNYLDVGCNLGYFLHTFNGYFDEVAGIDYDIYYVNLVKDIYPELNVSRLDLNQQRLVDRFKEPFDVITSLSMIEYVNDKKTFVDDLYTLAEKLVIVEGHSMDIINGNDKIYEGLLKAKDWKVTRLKKLTDPGVNAPPESKGRPIWTCFK